MPVRTRAGHYWRLKNRKSFDEDCATWLHKAREMPKEQFKREVEKELTGR